MTQLMGRPVLGLPSEPVARSALTDLLTGVRTALLSLSMIAVPVLGLWVAAPYADDTAAGAARLSCSLWLLGQGGPLVRGTGAAPLTITPLLLTVLDAALLHRAGRRIAERGRWQPRAPLALAAGYLAVAACAALACRGNDTALRSRPAPDLLAVALLVAGSLALGLRSPGRHSSRGHSPDGHSPAGHRGALRQVRWEQWVPGWAWAEGGATAARRAAAMWLLGATASGGVLLTVAVALGDAGRSARALGGGSAGLLGLLLACALLMPNAVLWAAAYALGPGFAVGAGTVAAPSGARTGAMPDFPLLALVPTSGGPGWWVLALVLPLAAGVPPALLLARAAGERAWRPAALSAVVLTGAGLAGAGAAVAAWVAGGALAAGRLAALGPVPWEVGPTATGWMVLVALPTALLRSQVPGAAQSVRVWTARTRVAAHLALTRLSDLGLRRAEP